MPGVAIFASIASSRSTARPPKTSTTRWMVERTEKGFRLGVHIADVSHYVTEGSVSTTRPARAGRRCTFPAACCRCWPERLSNGLCSLKSARRSPRPLRPPGARLRGSRDGREFVHGVIRSAHRMTYTEVARLLRARRPGDERRYGPSSSRSATWPSCRLAAPPPGARGSIDFDLPDADIVLDDAGLVVGIVPESRNVAHRLIEEFHARRQRGRWPRSSSSQAARNLPGARPPGPGPPGGPARVLESFGYELKAISPSFLRPPSRGF